MHIRRSEAVLGKHNLEKLIKSTRPDVLSGRPNSGDSILSNFVFQLDHGYNEHDAIVDALILAHTVIKDLTKNASINLNPKPLDAK